MSLIDWLRATCNDHELEPVAVYRRRGNHDWPFVADTEADLERKLREGEHFLALPKEPAALANIIEVSLVDFLLARINTLSDASARRGTERGYPDIEVTGKRFGDGHHAVDIKVARRARGGNRTQSRITLYTGNTYFRYPTLQWPGTFRPFSDYASHLDVIALYTLDETSHSRIEDFQLIVQEAWRIASRRRSSTTREYIGAVQPIADLESGNGEFDSEDAFYKFWRKYPFTIGRAVQRQLDRLLASQNDAEDGD